MDADSRAHARTPDRYAYMHDCVQNTWTTLTQPSMMLRMHTATLLRFNPSRKIELCALETKHRNATDCQTCPERRLPRHSAAAAITMKLSNGRHTRTHTPCINTQNLSRQQFKLVTNNCSLKKHYFFLSSSFFQCYFFNVTYRNSSSIVLRFTSTDIIATTLSVSPLLAE